MNYIKHDSNECGFHFSEESLRCAPDECEVPDSMSEDDCYGDCSITTMCTFSYETDFSTKARVPICYCPELSDQEPDDEDEVVYCQEIKNPQSQTDCDDGMCTVLMYGVECTYIENTLGFTECVCILPEDTETQDDYVPDKSLVDQIFISTKLDTFFRWGVKMTYNRFTNIYKIRFHKRACRLHVDETFVNAETKKQARDIFNEEFPKKDWVIEFIVDSNALERSLY